MEILKNLRPTPGGGHDAAHQANAPILAISNLTVRYDNLLALDDITLEIKAGERLAVIGPNGAGKSTLFKVVAGVLTPTSGEVKVAGYGPGGHICIAYVPQRSQVDWKFPVSVADVVMMGRIGKIGLFHHPRPADWDYVRQSLQVVGMETLASRQISELSGGQQQRMFIARALAQEAELMLMDEPLTGLDVTSQEDILQIMDRLSQRGVTVLASTHDLNLASQYFERVLLLNRRIYGLGHPSEIFTAEYLLPAFGGHLRLLKSDSEIVAVGDTCCEDESSHEHMA
jgi:ABC-type Mn2+/Zn2+ transport system ATPase subunit